MSRVFFDTNLFIYLFEDQEGRGKNVAALLERMEARGDQLITTAVTVGEVLVRPLQEANQELAQRYETLFQSPEIRVASFDLAAARRYAEIRQDRTIRPPDAIQLACAAEAGTDLFLSNDLALMKKTVPGIQFIATLETAPL